MKAQNSQLERTRERASSVPLLGTQVDAKPELEYLVTEITGRDPEVSAPLAEALAYLWDSEILEIISASLGMVPTEDVQVYPEIKDELIVSFVNLRLNMANSVLAAKEKAKKLSYYIPEEETAAIASPTGQERIFKTARNVYKGYWSPLFERWNSMLKSRGPSNTPRVFPGRALFTPERARNHKPTRENHFIPKFVTKKWANVHGEVFIFSRGLGDEQSCRRAGHSTWAKKTNLYSQRIEGLFAGIEGDANSPYRKFERDAPLDGWDVSRWITFVICQWMRNPATVADIVGGLDGFIKRRGLPRIKSPSQRRAVYETVFTHDRLYERIYRSIEARRWLLLEAPNNRPFLLGDTHLALEGPILDEASMLLCPVSPSKCFVAGPKVPGDQWPARYRPHRMSAEDTEHINAAIATVSASVIAPDTVARPQADGFLERYLGSNRVEKTFSSTKEAWWGKLVDAAST